ncbi:antitoxin Xre/MbcA/ParS toxin-binding domain-containing protein [Dyella subtropica]|uniref:antitoxin Xre/MbcA/ParS toxin-binding domain-containing protein n=1 Tax=Dyella subtropica TaxID=2992127 RepID=UPI003CE45C7C
MSHRSNQDSVPASTHDGHSSFIDELVKLVQTMVYESGDPHHFDAKQWVTEWLSTPLPALGGRKPIEFTNTQDDRELLKSLLRRTQSGAYS